VKAKPLKSAVVIIGDANFEHVSWICVLIIKTDHMDWSLGGGGGERQAMYV
jgi:hypothetical protein